MKRVVGVVVVLIFGGTGAAADAPIPVSPGDRDGVAVASDRCPTFHWTAVEGVETVSLVVYSVPEAESEGAPEHVLSVSLPGAASGWTPPLGRCFDPGGRYAWSVGVTVEGRTADWSAPSLFSVLPRPSVAEVEDALALLRSYLAAEGQDRQKPDPKSLPVAGSAPTNVGVDGPTPGRGEQVTRERLLAAVTREIIPHATPSTKAISAPTFGDASLTVDEQIHLDAASDVFKDGETFLWDEATVLGLGRRALAGNTSGIQNTAAGYYALSLNDTGYQNTAVGSSALKNNSSGARNTAVGALAMLYKPDGVANTAVGAFSLPSSGSGSRNTTTGALSMFVNSSGDDNTANGYKALFTNSSGSANTAIGVSALAGNISGDENTAVGYRALEGNTSGDDNTASGEQALRDNTTGYRNTATGIAALANNETGYSNTSVGASALAGNISGSYNTAVGDAALLATKGSRNTGLGAFAGTGDSVGTGTDNIRIASNGSNESHTLRIGRGTGAGDWEQNRAFISGIRDATLAGIEQDVCVDESDQVGPCSVSSRRFKEEVREMGAASADLLRLRPVLFRYKPGMKAADHPEQFGLIAEEVADVFPGIVTTDAEGRPFTVRYDLLSPMLVNELQKQHRQIRMQWALLGLMLLSGVAVSVGQWRSEERTQ